MTIGRSGNRSARHRSDMSKARRRFESRRILLESLESRQLMAVGPQLISIQPNEGALIRDGQVLQVSPNELVFRFDDSANIDPQTIGIDRGILISRSGGDGIFDRAYVSTDLGTNGAVVLDFAATIPGPAGNGFQVTFSKASRSDSSLPILSVSSSSIHVEVNTAPGLKTTAQDLLNAFQNNPAATAKVLTTRLRGLSSTVIADTVPTTQPLVLTGANTARATSNLNAGTNVQVEFLAAQAGPQGEKARLVVTQRDFGGAGLPVVSVDSLNSTVTIEMNSNAQFMTKLGEFVDAINGNPLATSILRARIISGASSTAIGAAPVNYSPIMLRGSNDIPISPAYVGLEGTSVVMRFAEALPDDDYRIDILGQGSLALRNLAGQAYNGGVDTSLGFALDLGARIEAVVPQPIVRNPDGSLTQARNEIHVYFNEDELNATDANDPKFYQLRYTYGTVDSNDDFVLNPFRVVYTADSHRAVLTFARNLDQLVDNNGGLLPIGAMRLRIGTKEAANDGTVDGKYAAPVVINIPATSADDPGSRFATARDLRSNWDLSGNGPRAVIVNSEIRNANPYLLDFPGANDEPGQRDNLYQHHIETGASDQPGIEVIEYNFQRDLGLVNNSAATNAITETQKQLVRTIVSLYENYLGLRFIETDNRGLTIAVGDMRAVSPDVPNGPGGITLTYGNLVANGQPATILDIQDFGNSNQNEFGSELFRTFARGIGYHLGRGDSSEVPGLTVQSAFPPNNPGVDTEMVFPGNADITYGQHLFRPESKDVDLYRFSLPKAGKLTVEISAERLANPSLLDASLRLYRLNATGGWDEISRNDDYFSQDSLILLNDLSAGEYIVGVSAKGNEGYDPKIDDSGLGGRSEGQYSLRMDFRPPQSVYMRDTTGTLLDGDSDGRPEGVFDFWFVPSGPSNTLYVDKATPLTTGTGTITAPFRTIAAAITAANAAPLNNRVIRIVGNGGQDGLIQTQADNLAYEIGFNRLGQAQADGETLNVPRNVTLMIDAGAILKLSRARIGVGSTTVSAGADRSGGSLQVLGVPRIIDSRGFVVADQNGDPLPNSVYFTSLNDRELGKGSNRDQLPPAPQRGDWGGLDLRNRIDASQTGRRNLEAAGLFLNSIVHADLRYGGGQVVVDGVSQVITPIHMVDTRPTIANSVISFSADAAMSATPNSFLESNFQDPATQGTAPFIADFDRVGPELHGNRLHSNTVNGLFIKTRTDATSSTEVLSLNGRFDDIDIVHVIGENLIVQGTVGGALATTTTPSSTTVILTPSNFTNATPGLAAGTYRYRFSIVRSGGVEGPASEPTNSVSVLGSVLAPSGFVRLSNLPVLQSGEQLKIYRSQVVLGVDSDFGLVGTVTGNQSTFVDSSPLAGATLIETTIPYRSRLNGSLAIDPGIQVKLKGARIEVQGGGQLLAEGTESRPITFTSLEDTRFGAGGTFDTANRNNLLNGLPINQAVAGNWGGLYLAQTSSASLDHLRLFYGGGTTRIDGGFASFNAIEAHQAELRLTHSTLENNASGVEDSAPTNRAGRGTNFTGTIFVRGAQPIIVDNIIQDNAGAALNIDVDSLNATYLDDGGRSTGKLDKVGSFLNNQGPLVAQNRLDNNAINGMIVRGQTLTTESVWDDTDMVHVVLDEVVSSNLYTYGGLKLVSKNSQSLVVKFQGDSAGLTATGQFLDINDRIGGSVQIVGQPGFPVILTSLTDDTVGAGFTPDGRPIVDTNNDGTESDSTDTDLPTGPEVDRGTLIDNDVPQDVPGFFSAQPRAGGELTTGTSGITAEGRTQTFINQSVIFNFLNYIDVGADGTALSLSNTTITLPPTLVAPDLVASEGNFLGNNGETVNWRVESRFDNGVSSFINTLTFTGTAPLGDIRYINYLDEDVLGVTDDLLYTRGTPGQADFRIYTVDGAERFGFSQAGIYTPGPGLQNATYAGWTADQFPALNTAILGPGTQYTIAGNINTTALPQSNDPALGTIFGPNDVTTALAWDFDPNATTATITTFLELLPREQRPASVPGEWRGILLETESNDRNVLATQETESATSISGQTQNDLPARAQYLGTLSGNINSGDENAVLGFQVHGVLNRDADMDIYAFEAKGGTEVWLDIDKTSNSLDTVIELIDSNGTILALSDNSYDEDINPNLIYRNPIQSSLAANPLRKSAREVFPTDTFGAARDQYGTNPKDAGLRIALPGVTSQYSLYHVRVRSSNAVGLSDSARLTRLTDPSLVSQGQSRGSYQLQIRLGEVQEFPGSGVSYADIRYATTGVDIAGLPRHSPLLGELAEQENRANFTDNNTVIQAQELGNLLQTDRGTISLAGNLSSPDDIDWYTFTLDYQLLETALNEYLSTIFDIDYADGIGRPDTSLYLFRDVAAAGQPSDIRLIQSGLNSNILDDRSLPIAGADLTDLDRGSAGNKDAFLGPTALPAGRYFVAITSQRNIPSGLLALFDPNQGDPTIRFQPVNSTQYLVEDHVSQTGLLGNGVGGSNALPPVLNGNFITDTSVIQYLLGDVPLYVSVDAGIQQTGLFIVNAATGQLSNNVALPLPSQTIAQDLRDIAFRFNGDLRAYNGLETRTPVTGDRDDDVDYFHINDGNATIDDIGDLNIQTSQLDVQGETTDSDVGVNIEALTFTEFAGQEQGFFISNRALRPGVVSGSNVIYRFNPDTGVAIDSVANPRFIIDNANGPDIILGNGTNINEVGFIDTDGTSLFSTSLIAGQATNVHAISGTTYSIEDGDIITLRLNPNFTTTFEFNAGPQVDISLDPINGNTNGRILADGNTFTLDGIVFEIDTSNNPPANTPTRGYVRYQTSMSNAEFADSLRNTLTGYGFNVGQKGTRFNFSGAVIGDFTQLPALVATPRTSTGNITPGNTEITFLANDSAATIAFRISQAINQAGFPGLTASVNGTTVNIVGGTVEQTTGLVQRGGLAPGGTVTGIAFVNGAMYGVSDRGGLYRVDNLSGSPLSVSTYLTTLTDLRGNPIPFSGLAAGPKNAEGGKYASMLFATDLNGNLHAFDLQGNRQGVFAGGLSTVNTGLRNLNGLAFSNLDYNLWHRTNNRSGDAGHGLVGSPDGAIGSEQATNGNAGQSWWFGFENRFSHPGIVYSAVTDPTAVARFSGEAVAATYNFAGGASGILESQSFSLTNIAAADQPVLYFNYFLSTEDRNSNDPLTPTSLDMLDSFRVLAVGDDGVWRVLTTNNSDRGPGTADDELDALRSGFSKTMETFDNNATTSLWRQARVDLSELAGNQDIRLRFEFNTAGGFGLGRPGGLGPEMKVVAGNRLRDGDTFTINGQVFEIETGPTLIAPAGNAISNGDFVSIPVQGNTQAVRFQFYDGTGPAPTPSQYLRVIPFTKQQASSEIATNLFNEINSWITPSNFPNPVVSNVVLQETGGVTLDSFNDIGVNRQSIQVGGRGRIDPTPPAPGSASDIDYIQVNLEASSTIDIVVQPSSGSSLAPVVRFFDRNGVPLPLTPSIQGGNPALSTTVAKAGLYYIGISSSGNTTYSPIVEGTSLGGLTSGDYDFIVNVTNRMVPYLSGNQLQFEGGSAPSLSPNSKFVVSGNSGAVAYPVRINSLMTANEVARAVELAMNDVLTQGSGLATTRRQDYLSVTGLTVNDVGPFLVTSAPNGYDDFSEYRRDPSVRPATRAQNNAFEGVYLDDFIIGVTEMGESVSTASSDPTFVVNPQAITNAINLGPYQLEIRGGQDYILPSVVGGNPPAILSDSFGVNERLAPGQTWKFTGAENIVDGDTVIVSDGIQSITVEFNDTTLGNGVTTGNFPLPYSPQGIDPKTGAIQPDSAAVIASRFRDLLNSPSVQSKLDIYAVSLNGATSGLAGDALAVSANAVLTPSRLNTTNPLIAVSATNGLGHQNTRREQGQVTVRNSRISFAETFGINIRPDARDPLTDAAQPGSVRNTVVLNAERLAAGAVVINNELIGNLSGGVNISGDIFTAVNIAASVPFVRVVNNTIVGGRITDPSNTEPIVIGDLIYVNGGISFADAVTSYNANFSGGPSPIAGLDQPTAALQAPDYLGGTLEPTIGQGAVSLGRGGQLVVSFTDNFLTGSGDTRPDLAIYEVGESERVFVEVSSDGNRYTSVGTIDGFRRTIDLDAFGFNPSSRLRFVRLTDDANDGSISGDSVGADIDAVGALSTLVIPSYAPLGTGILVGPNASPTLLNNILVNHLVGLDVDPTSNSTVVGGTLFQRNTANTARAGRVGQFATLAVDTDELFVDPTGGLFYPQQKAKSIDSSVDSLVDRAILLSVKQPLGLDASPILAPNFDLNGLLRVDDPSITSSNGTGQNVFKDLGAQERSDFLGPTVAIVQPMDNDNQGLDLNPLVGSVELNNFTAKYFDIRLFDGAELDTSIQGIGIDPTSVSKGALIVTEDGQPLAEGVDYRFGFDSSTGIIRLTPIAGVWRSDATYQIRFLNRNEQAIEAKSISDSVDGTIYSIIDGPSIYTFEVDMGYRATVPTAGTSSTHALVDGQQFTLTDGINVVVFEFDTNTLSTAGTVVIAISPTESASSVATKIVAAIAATGLNVQANLLTSNSLQILGATAQLTNNSNLEVTGAPGVLSGATPILLDARVVSDASSVATQIALAINSAAIPGVNATTIGGTVVVTGADNIAGDSSQIISGIRDKAGNALRPNQVDDQTILTISLGEGFDYGDAPDPSYASLKANNGPRHTVISGFQLGNTVTIDADARANNSDTDDGVTFGQAVVQGFQSQVIVAAAGIGFDRAGYLSAWIDFDGNGQFEANERITNSLLANDILVNGNNTLTFSVPGTAKPGNTFARFRYSSTRNLSPIGEANDGEVEDFAVNIVGNPYRNQSNNLDVNGDGSLSPIDALQVINFLSRNGSSVPLTYPANRPVPPYVDVNGDSFVSPIDVLLVINGINRQSQGEGEAANDNQTWIPAAAAAQPNVLLPDLKAKPPAVTATPPSVPAVLTRESAWVDLGAADSRTGDPWQDEMELASLPSELAPATTPREVVLDAVLADWEDGLF
jgi:hypothetical protein